MKLWKKLSLMGLGVTGAVVGGVISRSSSGWNKKTTKLLGELQPPPNSLEAAQTVDFKELKGLPQPVAKYFRLVLKDGQPLVRFAKVNHTGRFNLTGKENGWSTFKSTQNFSANPAGFVWDASVSMAPLIEVRVRDSYVNGEAAIQAKILSLVSVANEHDKPELNSGSLMRYLAEAVWFPTALLPSAGVEWKAIDKTTAQATLKDGDTTVSLEFHFNEKGEIISVFSPERFRDVKGKYELAAWAVNFWDYQEKNGMRIPIEGKVEWQLNDENLPYWRGQISEIEYTFATDTAKAAEAA